MSEGTILITGGSGFLGVSLAQWLLKRQAGRRFILTDVVRSTRMGLVAHQVIFVQADLADPIACARLVTPEVATVFHFASLVSGGAEMDFEGGYRANLHATLNLLEACRKQGQAPRFVFTSSIATFGGARLPETVTDWTYQHPQNSYGVAKVIGEQLLNDYSRKGFIDGRGLRLPAIVVRDEPNTAVSGYVSALIREPIAMRDYVCPVPPETRMPILSIARCVELLAKLSELPADALGDYRTLNGPGISPSAQEIAASVRRSKVPGLGAITFKPDPAIAEVVRTWPKYMRAERAEALGLKADSSIEDIVSDYTQQLGLSRQ